MLHVRFEGRSFDVPEAALGLADSANDRAVFNSLARYLDVDASRFTHYVVDHRPNGARVVRPEAVYG